MATGAPKPLIPSRLVRVLIVEDEPRLRELLADVVPGMGFEAVAARSAEEASRKMAAEPFDVLLLDLQLPGIGGMDFFESVRRDEPEVQVIILTGYGDLDSARRAIRLDVVDFLTKPFHLNDVESALDRARRRVLEHRRRDGEPTPVTPGTGTLEDAERAAIIAALKRHGGNRTAAAAELGISRRKLHYWLADNPVDPG
jgi:DNA-binding NtrC family response regulator